jgi:hypothetical protein
MTVDARVASGKARFSEYAQQYIMYTVRFAIAVSCINMPLMIPDITYAPSYS